MSKDNGGDKVEGSNPGNPERSASSKPRKSLQTKLTEAAERRAHWESLEKQYQAKQKTADEKALDLDKRLLGSVAMAAAGRDATLAGSLAGAIAAAIQASSRKEGVLRPKDVKHITRDNGLAVQLKGFATKATIPSEDSADGDDAEDDARASAATVTEPATADHDQRSSPTEAAPGDDGGGTTASVDDDVPKVGYFESPFEKKAEIDAIGARPKKFGDKFYRIANGRDQVLAMRALGVREIEQPC